MTPAGGGEGAAGRPGRERVAAVIDIGSNSVLLLTVGVGPDGQAHPRDAAVATTRLGTGLASGGRLDPAARRRTCETAMAFAERARRSRASHLWAFGTGAMRAAADGPAFAREVAAAIDAPVEVLAGDREAALAYAAAAGAAGGPLLVADLGGRTVELTLGLGREVLASASLELGALVLTEAHLRADPPTASEVGRVRAAADEALASSGLAARARARGARLTASGGTATALAALDLGLRAYDASRVHGHVLSRTVLRALAERLAAMPLGARIAMPGLDAGRAAILPAGALVLERTAEAAGASEVRVSDRGVRHAYLTSRLVAAGWISAP